MQSGRSDRIAYVIVLALILPALATLIWEIYFSISDSSNSGGHGDLLRTYAMYATGFIVWTCLRVVIPRGASLIVALTVFIVGLPFTIAISLGIYALFLPLSALGGVVASLAYPSRRPLDS